MTQSPKNKSPRSPKLSRRLLLGAAAAAGASAAFPHIWVPRSVRAATSARGKVKHLIYIRLSGGFRFPTAFNADVADQFNPFGQASGVPEGVQWGPSALLNRSGYLGEDALADLEVQSVAAAADRITVMPTVDHEPLAGRADGNHETGLERYYTGYVNGEAGFFTRISRGLQNRYSLAAEEGNVLLPPFVMGGAGMARGFGEFAPFRPPVLNGATFDRFGAQDGGALPDWTTKMVRQVDLNMRDKQHPALRERVDAYLRSREATEQYAQIFASEALKVDNNSNELIDGVSNAELSAVFGRSRESTNLRLALRLFKFGCPAVYLDQGGYDYHSGEEDALPGAIERLNRLISSLLYFLPKMEHPDGGTYWDHTVVAIGSEFSRTARGSRFNSAAGSDHNGDNSTRWMSMPFFGGPVPGGRVVGATTSRDELKAEGTVHSYRSVMNTLMDGLGCDESVYFPADDCIQNLLGDA